MNVLDIFLAAALLASIFIGARVGLVRQICVTACLVVAALVVAFLQYRFASIATTGSDVFFFVAMVLLGVVIIALFFDLGLSLGGFLHKEFKLHKYAGLADNSLGGMIGGFTAITVILLWSSMLTLGPTTAAGQVKQSYIINHLRQTFPKVPELFAQAAYLLGPNSLPQAFAGDEPDMPTLAVLPTKSLVERATGDAAASVVQITGKGCGGTIHGTGFVVKDGVVATNAHVVAGIPKLQVIDRNGVHSAAAVWYDPKLDFALLVVSNLAGTPLPITTARLQKGTQTATMGYSTGSLQARPAAIEATITASGYDIYNRNKVDRYIYVLHDSVESGDSGGPLLTTDGRVVGMVFAKSLESAEISYALTADQINGPIQHISRGSTKVSTGDCGVR